MNWGKGTPPPVNLSYMWTFENSQVTRGLRMFLMVARQDRMYIVCWGPIRYFLGKWHGGFEWVWWWHIVHYAFCILPPKRLKNRSGWKTAWTTPWSHLFGLLHVLTTYMCIVNIVICFYSTYLCRTCVPRLCTDLVTPFCRDISRYPIRESESGWVCNVHPDLPVVSMPQSPLHVSAASLGIQLYCIVVYCIVLYCIVSEQIWDLSSDLSESRFSHGGGQLQHGWFCWYRIWVLSH